MTLNSQIGYSQLFSSGNYNNNTGMYCECESVGLKLMSSEYHTIFISSLIAINELIKMVWYS